MADSDQDTVNDPLRVAVIGLGYFGARHAQVYATHPAAKLVAVCDVDAALGERVAAETGAAAYADFAAMLARGDVDAVSVCMPDRLHEEAAVAVAGADKAMLLEKPLAHEAAAARRIVQAVEAAGTRLMVGHILRFDPRYVQVYEASAPEAIGEIVHVRAERTGIRATAARLGARTSILFYMGVHDIDAMQWVARSRIAQVFARKREVLGTGNEDSLFAVVTFENGAIGAIAYSWAWPDGLTNGYRAALEIVGTRSAAYMTCADQGFYTVGDTSISGGDTHLWPSINGRIVGDLADEIDHFIRATRSGAPYVQAYAEALDAIPVLDALARSAESGQPVEVDRG
ncbi:MAG: Gfo/Idh/MocA family oxidoreductase [Hyphomicrobiales bacterium]|nr:Gfo/Idh/MocA family oxidoreductase [Hyphomicrobiales bacterium]